MKKIILFSKGVETLQYFSIQLQQAFEKMGYDTFLFPLEENPNHIKRLEQFAEDGNTIMLTFNFHGISQETMFYNKSGQLFWEVHHIPCINIVVDHPFYYFRELEHPPKDYYQICIDRFHEQYMKQFYPEITTLGFLPLAGTSIQFPKPIEERSIDIIFTGNYSPLQTFERHVTRLGTEYENFYRSIIQDLTMHTDRTMEEVFIEHMESEMGKLSIYELREGMSNLIFIDLIVRFFFRGQLIQTLLEYGLTVHVFGKGWEQLEGNFSKNLVIGGLINSRQCLEQISNAKLSLNCMPWFKDGAHDRIFNSMLNGAVCITDTSIYLQEQFTDDTQLCFYSLSELNTLPDKIQFLLQNPIQMQQIADCGYQKASFFHTWEYRAKQLVELIPFLNESYGDDKLEK